MTAPREVPAESDLSSNAQRPAAGALSVGIIMDGNGRWAAARGLPRFEGHRRGVDALRRAVRAAPELGVRYLTLYSFSLENWSRPRQEVMDLMGLLKRFIRNDLAELQRNNVQVRVMGEREGLGADIISLIDEAEELTRNNDALILTIAFNYGSRQEIAKAMRAIATQVQAGLVQPDAIDTALIARTLDTFGVPDPDFIIRTSGEQRLSNFLLWQAAYAEFVFLDLHWPDFDTAAFRGAIEEFANRNRRFGGLATSDQRSVKTGS